jgi:large subunit ribosomal protein L29
MMKKNVNELKDKSLNELKAELTALLKERFNLRMQHATRQLSQTHALRIVRRNIARVLTFLHKKLGKAS